MNQPWIYSISYLPSFFSLCLWISHNLEHLHPSFLYCSSSPYFIRLNTCFLHPKNLPEIFQSHLNLFCFWHLLKIQTSSSLKVKSESYSAVSRIFVTHGIYSPWNTPSQNTGVGSCSILQRIFPTQGPNPGLPHCRQILYQLSHKGGPIFSLLLLNFVTYIFLYNNNKTFQDTGYVL